MDPCRPEPGSSPHLFSVSSCWTRSSGAPPTAVTGSHKTFGKHISSQDLHPRTQSWESRPDARAQREPAVLPLAHIQPINGYDRETRRKTRRRRRKKTNCAVDLILHNRLKQNISLSCLQMSHIFPHLTQWPSSVVLRRRTFVCQEQLNK